MRARAALLGCVLAASCAAGTPARETVEPSSGIALITVPAGTFMMGSPELEPGHESQEVLHQVTISRAFQVGKFEVTQRQWQAVMGTNPSRFAGDPDRPVEQVTFIDVGQFLARLNERVPGGGFRLPTEAEWEYVCRAGSAAPYSTGTTLGPDQANVAATAAGEVESLAAGRQTARVGSYAPNGWGVHDMHGNVWEWTADDHCPYPADAVADPVSSCGGPLKVIRGGSWYFTSDSARCGLRYTHPPGDRGFSLGFRVARDVD